MFKTKPGFYLPASFRSIPTSSASCSITPFPPLIEIVPTLSQIRSRYSISLSLKRVWFSSISLAVFKRLLVEATSSLRVITLAWARFYARSTVFMISRISPGRIISLIPAETISTQ